MNFGGRGCPSCAVTTPTLPDATSVAARLATLNRKGLIRYVPGRMIATCGPLDPPFARNASPSWNWLHSTSSPRSRPFGKGRPSMASTLAISFSATWMTFDLRMLHTTGMRQYRPGIKVAACVPISPCRAMTCPGGIFLPPSLFTRTPTSPDRIRYRPFRTNAKTARSANAAPSATAGPLLTKSTMLFPSVHDMCLWAHEPCLGLPAAYARSLAGSAGTYQNRLRTRPRIRNQKRTPIRVADPLPWLAGGTNRDVPLPIAKAGAIRQKARPEEVSGTCLRRKAQPVLVAKSDASQRPPQVVAVAVLCHICHRPTLLACRNCGRPACDEHLAGSVCVECRVGRRGSRPGVQA